MKQRSYESGYRTLKRLSSSGRFPTLTVQRAKLFLKEWPHDAASWLILGIALVDLARYEEAKRAMDKALEFCPKEARNIPLAQMGHLFRERGDYGEAAAWYRKAINAKPQDATYHIFLGALLEKVGRLDDAEQCFRTATSCHEGPIDEAFFMLGLVLRDQDRLDEAVESLRETMRLDPKYKLAKLALRDIELCIKEEKKEKRYTRIPNPAAK